MRKSRRKIKKRISQIKNEIEWFCYKGAEPNEENARIKELKWVLNRRDNK